MSEYVKTRKQGRKKNAGKRWIIVAVIGFLLLIGALAYLGSGSGAIGDATDAASRNEAAETELESAVSELSASLNFEEEVKSEQTQNPAELPEVEPSTDEPDLSESATTLSPELRAILRQHWDAMGGMRNWSKVESIRLNGTIERDGQLVEICIVKKRPNQIRATINLPLPGSDEEKLQVIRAHDGKTAWTATRLAGAPEMVKEELPSEAAAELLADAGVLPPLIKLWREGAEFELLKSKVIDGENTYRLGTKEKTPLQYIFYLSSDSYQLLAYDSIKSDGTVTRTSLKNFAKAEGILIPRKSVIESPATGTSTMTTNSVEVGVGIYEEYFGPGELPRTAQTE